MDYREAKVGESYPALEGDAKAKFLHEFANLTFVSVTVWNGEVMDNTKAESMYGMSYFNGWKWQPYILMCIAKGKSWPEPDFVAFVHDMVTKLELIKR